jgi:hypothetical protein
MNALKKIGCEVKGYSIDISIPYKKEMIGIKQWGKLDYLSQEGYLIHGFYKGRDYIFRKGNNKKPDPNSKRSKKHLTE